jgi:hypothetical protein
LITQPPIPATNTLSVFPLPGLSYPSNKLLEGPTGHFTGYCPFPPSITCSSIAAAINKLCSFLFPPGAPPAEVSAPGICLNLQLAFIEVPIFFECVAALEGLGNFCKLIKNTNVASTLCSRIPFPATPTSVEIQITVEGEGNDLFMLSNAVDIKSTGDAIQENFGTYTVDEPCTTITVSPYTCAPSTPPSSTTTSTTTTAGGACDAVPTIVDGGFEDGQQALANYEFPAGGTFDVVCGGANGLDAACGNCFG